MKTTSLLSPALAALCALAIAGSPAPQARAADAPSLRSLDDKAPALPLTVSFDKVSGTEDGPYVLKLTNGSKDAIKVTVKIFPSVTFHANAKERDLPEHAIDAGQVWSVPGLASTDKLTVTADGFAPLDITVP
jgi:hypothetical protein